jgi:hypothetical protein
MQITSVLNVDARSIAIRQFRQPLNCCATNGRLLKDVKQLLIQKIARNAPKAKELSQFLDKLAIPFYRIDTVNWAAFPYRPEASFRIAHTGEAILLHYRINESDIKAVCSQDNGKVWEDSCVEFFVSFDNKQYYNIECNCIGKILIGKGSGKQGRIPLPEALLTQVDRWSSLGDSPVENRSGDWEVSLVIPKEVFYPEIINTFDAVKAKGNFYKCGDCLQTPHFLSWNPIKNETPNFHLPEFFGEFLFD